MPTVRPPREFELARCRALLPAAFPAFGRLPELLVHESADGIDAAAAVAWMSRGFPILLHVEPDARRRGIGRALVRSAISRVRGETSMLRAWSNLPADSMEAKFLIACGFETIGLLQVYELEPSRLRASIAGLLERARRRVPAGARLVPLTEAPREPLVELVAANLTTPRPYLEEALFGGGRSGFDQGLSIALVVNGILAGTVLAHRAGDTMEVDLNVVDPEWRGGWANLLQVDGILRAGHEAGLGRLRFLAASHVHNTINLAARGGGVRLADLLTLALPLRDDAPPTAIVRGAA